MESEKGETLTSYGAYVVEQVLNLYLPALVCVKDQRTEKPNHLHNIISRYVCQAY
jgi:hypothetical protein